MPTPVLNGISIEQYAGVTIGRAEGVPIAHLFSELSIDADSWEMAEHAWLDYLTDRDEDTELQSQLHTALTEARNRYERQIDPLSDDLAAWLCFLRHWAAHADKLSMLAQLDLRASDVLRLHQRWSDKLAEQPALAAEAKDLLEGELQPLPAIRVQHSDDTTGNSVIESTLELPLIAEEAPPYFTSAAASPDGAPNPAAPIHPSASDALPFSPVAPQQPPDPAAAPLHPSASDALPFSPVAPKPPPAATPPPPAAAPPPPAAAPSPPAVAAAPSPPAAAPPPPAVSIPAPKAPPPRTRAKPPPAKSAPVQTSPAQSGPADQGGQTVFGTISPFHQTAITPFQAPTAVLGPSDEAAGVSGEAETGNAQPQAADPSADTQPPPPDAGKTVFGAISPLHQTAITPFKAASAATAIPPAATTHHDAAPSDDSNTTDGGKTVFGTISPFHRGAITPFDAPATPPPANTATPADASIATPAPASIATPAPASIATPAPASIATPAPASIATPAPASIATPAPASTATPSTARLTIEQYASLCAELARFKDNAEAIIARYGLNTATKQDEDRIHGVAMQHAPKLYARWHAAYQAHLQWLQTQHA